MSFRRRFKKYNNIPARTPEETTALLLMLEANAVPLLSLAYKDHKDRREEGGFSDYICKCAEAVSTTPHLLTEKWVRSINKMILSWEDKYELEDPGYEVGEKVVLENLIVASIKRSEKWNTYGIIAKDGNGWSYHFSTGKGADFVVGTSVSVSAKVKGHDLGISFLQRPHIKSWSNPPVGSDT